MYLGAGQATGVGSVGGSIEVVAGGSASKGGDVSILSGSGEITSGKIVISSNTAVAEDSASGDVLVGSGSSSGAQAPSGAGERESLLIYHDLYSYARYFNANI